MGAIAPKFMLMSSSLNIFRLLTCDSLGLAALGAIAPKFKLMSSSYYIFRLLTCYSLGLAAAEAMNPRTGLRPTGGKGTRYRSVGQFIIFYLFQN